MSRIILFNIRQRWLIKGWIALSSHSSASNLSSGYGAVWSFPHRHMGFHLVLWFPTTFKKHASKWMDSKLHLGVNESVNVCVWCHGIE